MLGGVAHVQLVAASLYRPRFAKRDSDLMAQIAKLQAQVAELRSQIDEYKKVIATKDEEITRFKNLISNTKASRPRIADGADEKPLGF
jgi:uncharacterized protein YhaN